ncbi:PTS transporter subunit IIC [Fusibacter sp. 3D3]|uniref:PTS transporter subunit IIC n=1 Tax=Fusibacter sp. 3D3 TaxID=1048380 RepID=UPI0008586D04|nr:PTS sugar transporter subunit IIC [Fusibacter sp. 3D3]GAU76855.1 predicted nicotinate-regulated transporter BH3254 [Fusibacter sp. 3D3]
MVRIKNYLIKTLNGMALGLFASLIIGLILKQIGDLTGIQQLATFGKVAQVMMGPAIGAAVAYSVGASPLGIFASVVAGTIGAGSIKMDEAGQMIIGIGEPMGAFVSGLVAAEFSKLISGKTKVDIVLVPALTIIVGGLVGLTLSPVIASLMKAIGAVINTATELQPIPMGIIIAVIMGIVLTLPISSAALAISLGLSGIAAGASLVGCCCQMIGFACISYRENGIGGFIAQGLGTSMLQVPNIIRNPKIWIPSIVASAILGPVSTAVLHLESNSIGAGMGTSGLVGQFGTFAAMGETHSALSLFILIGIMHFVLPGIIALIISEWMRKKGWISFGDLKLEGTHK